MQKHTKAFDRIIIHCSATPAGRKVSVEDIRRWHVDERGWDDIGYHYVVGLDGTVRKGRPVKYMGAHAAGHNDGTIGVCYVGGVSADDISLAVDTRTPAQKHALRNLVAQLRTAHGPLEVLGHRDLPGVKKACPSFAAAEEYRADRMQPAPPLKPISDSRTMRGGIPTIAGVATASGGALSALGSLDPLTQAIIGVGLVLALLGGGYVVWNRWQERKRGER